MNTQIERIFERVCGPLERLSSRLAVGRCPSCQTDNSLFIDLETGDFRCGRVPDALVAHPKEVKYEQKTMR